MTNTGKALIIGLVLIDLAVAAYLLVPRGERTKAANGTVAVEQADAERPLAPSTGSLDSSASTIGAVPASPRASDTHVVGGSVLPDAPTPPANTGAIATAPLPPHQPPVHTSRSAAVHAPAEPKAAMAANVQANSHGAPANAYAVQPNAHASGDLSRQGSNTVAAAMTAALVKESSKPDPSLPMPPGAMQSPQSQTPARDGQYPHGSTAVGAAMTQELVRQSAHVDPVSQPAVRGGAQ
ncbi:hypothetical protein LFL96_29120 [Paraburkholderia sp. D15]|uniref:hypothetical protein n=1 Tax=Paraburkholderia sp. D15 TaxID=2880218 RepID=UPI0024799A72|nr:hypothetical protein [Paraburkholderia sp. D15]WGS52261.1 hypothetical protein LFL96_29120 [Paraburkholderia sp. D15]